MKTLLKSTLALALLILIVIGLNAALDYWPSNTEPRAFRPIRWIANIFAIRPFGLSSPSFWLLMAGVSGVLLIGTNAAGRGKTTRGHKSGGVAQELPVGSVSSSVASRRRQFGRTEGEKPLGEPSIANDEITALFATDRDIEPLPAWRLVQAPPESGATSWLGGEPRVHGDFAWPSTAEGRPMLFLAQIDLSLVSGNDLPSVGAMLFFLGKPDNDGWDYSTRVLAKAELACAGPMTAPDKAVAPHEIGWSQNEGVSLQHTAITLEAYRDENTEDPVSKMFGVEVEDPFGFHYPEGHRNLLFLEHHVRFGTASENWQGMSIACAARDAAAGNFNSGRIFGCHKG